MAKVTGLKQKLFIGKQIGNNKKIIDVSGDVGSIDSLNMSRTLIDVTSIEQESMERLGGLGDLEMSFKSYYRRGNESLQGVLKEPSDDDFDIIWRLTPEIFFFFTGANPSFSFNRNDDGGLEINSSFQITNGLLGEFLDKYLVTDSSKLFQNISSDQALVGVDDGDIIDHFTKIAGYIIIQSSDISKITSVKLRGRNTNAPAMWRDLTGEIKPTINNEYQGHALRINEFMFPPIRKIGLEVDFANTNDAGNDLNVLVLLNPKP